MARPLPLKRRKPVEKRFKLRNPIAKISEDLVLGKDWKARVPIKVKKTPL